MLIWYPYTEKPQPSMGAPKAAQKAGPQLEVQFGEENSVEGNKSPREGKKKELTFQSVFRTDPKLY